MTSRLEQADVHAGLQAALVPPILYSGDWVEAYGRTVPKEQLGGDLADLVAHGQDVIAYVIDVCGHGLRAGVLMGMAKAAFRYGLLLGLPLERILRDLNSLVESLREGGMYLTLAGLRFSGHGEVEYIAAGHVPLLQYSHRTGSVIRYEMAQFPIGMFAGVRYESRRIEWDAGDLFVLVTEGAIETGDDPDAEGGLQKVSEVVRQRPSSELPDIAAGVLAATTAQGAQQDDATILLLRCRTRPAAPVCPISQALTSETTWARLLDELASELASQ